MRAIIDQVRSGGDAARARADRALRPRRARARRARRAAGGDRQRRGRAGAGRPRRSEGGDREREGSRSGPAARRGACRPRAGTRGADRGAARATRGRVHPRRTRAVSVDGGHVRDHRTRRGRGRVRGLCAARSGRQGAPDDPRRLRAVRGQRGLPDGRSAGDRRARLRHGVGEAGRRDRRAGQPLCDRGQAPGGRRCRDRRARRAERARGGRDGGRGAEIGRARPHGPGRARARRLPRRHLAGAGHPALNRGAAPGERDRPRGAGR